MKTENLEVSSERNTSENPQKEHLICKSYGRFFK